LPCRAISNFLGTFRDYMPVALWKAAIPVPEGVQGVYCKAHIGLRMVTIAAKRARERANPAILNSWKEIAMYLGRSVRTVQRWCSELQLPIHKVRATPRSPVFAYKLELDGWMRQCAQRDGKDSRYVSRDGTKSSAGEKAKNSMDKMSLLVSQQQDQLQRLAEQVSRLAQSQRSRRSKAGLMPLSLRYPKLGGLF
jgi:hypothetical protein